MRVVLDTNVLVSGLMYPSGLPGRIVALWRNGGLEVALSRYILHEAERVLPRLGHHKLTPDEARDLIDTLYFEADIVEPALTPDASLRDDSDQVVLGTLRASGAAYLITGDKDLLALSGEYPIITPAMFWERHG